MKALIVLAAISFSALVSQANILPACFRAVEIVSSSIPNEICFENVELNREKTLVIAQGRLSDVSTWFLTVTGISQRKENKFSFTSQTTILDLRNGHCDSTERAELKVNGVSDWESEPSVYLKDLEVSVDYTVNPDTCHSKANYQNIEYRLVR